MYSKGKYFILQCIVMLISPITSLFVSIRFYKSEISQLFFIIFAFYFGSHIHYVSDLLHHYDDMMILYAGRNVNEIFADERIYLVGQDYYHILFKLIVSRISLSPRFFGGAACAAYATFFIFFFRQLKVFYNNYKLTILNALLMLTITFIIEYYWFLGLRFRTGVFYFAAFYLKYVNTNKKICLLALLVTPLFHYSLITLVVIFLLDFVLRYTGILSRIILLIASIFIRLQNIDFVPLMLKYIPITKNLGVAITDDRIRNNVRDTMAEMRSEGNFFYRQRNDILLFFGFIILYFLWKYNAFKDRKYRVLFTFALTTYTVANFGYGDLTFYDRFYQIAVLFFYTYLFALSFIHANRIHHKLYLISIFMLPPMLYAAATQIVEQREFLFHLNLFFGNFFSVWDSTVETVKDFGWRPVY